MALDIARDRCTGVSVQKLPRTQVRLFGRSWPSFQLCGRLGLFAGIALGMTLVVKLGLSTWVLGAIVATAVATFLVLVLVTKIAIRKESIIYYHHEIAVVTEAALFLRFLHLPVLPYLDITVLGLGLFLACGRVGCFLVGCCHGRPCRWGICYSQEHASAGFTRYYVGVPLFPVQALESFRAFGIVAIGSTMVLRSSPPGTAFSWDIIVYGLGRFCLEFLRGDPERPYFFGFSEAQWTSLILMSLTVSSELSRTLPMRPWHLGITLALVFVMIAVSVHRRLRETPTHWILQARHIREVARALEYAAEGRSRFKAEIRVGCTSLGIQISSAAADNSAGEICTHYCLSRRGQPMTLDAAATLASVICRLQHHPPQFRLISGNNHVFHCLILVKPKPTEEPTRSLDRPRFTAACNRC